MAIVRTFLVVDEGHDEQGYSDVGLPTYDSTAGYTHVDLNGYNDGQQELQPPNTFYGQTITFTLAGGDSSDYILVEDAEAVITTATGAAKFYSTNADFTVDREMTFAGQVQTMTATKCGVVTHDVMPKWLKITDTSSSTNVISVTIAHKRGHD